MDEQQDGEDAASGATTGNATEQGVVPPPLSRARLAAAVGRILITSAALIVLYGAAPVDTDTTVGALALMVLAGAFFTIVFTHHVRALHHTPYPVLRAANLLSTTLLLFILGFSLTYLALFQADPGSFSEPLSKISAVYFTVTVLATVGFGDITATTDLTRAVVTLQMLTGITLIGILVRYVVGLASSRARTIRSQR